jgi:hypothetical protein
MSRNETSPRECYVQLFGVRRRRRFAPASIVHNCDNTSHVIPLLSHSRYAVVFIPVSDISQR